MTTAAPTNGRDLCGETNPPSMGRILPDELAERLGTDDEPFLLDIRPESDHERDAIDASRNVPVYDDLRAGDESALRRRLDEIPTTGRSSPSARWESSPSERRGCSTRRATTRRRWRVA